MGSWRNLDSGAWSTSAIVETLERFLSRFPFLFNPWRWSSESRCIKSHVRNLVSNFLVWTLDYFADNLDQIKRLNTWSPRRARANNSKRRRLLYLRVWDWDGQAEDRRCKCTRTTRQLARRFHCTYSKIVRTLLLHFFFSRPSTCPDFWIRNWFERLEFKQRRSFGNKVKRSQRIDAPGRRGSTCFQSCGNDAEKARRVNVRWSKLQTKKLNND